MKAVESVDLQGGRNDELMYRFAAAFKGDYLAQWAEFTHEQRTEFVQKFSDDIEQHAKNAFDVGVRWAQDNAAKQ